MTLRYFCAGNAKHGHFYWVYPSVCDTLLDDLSEMVVSPAFNGCGCLRCGETEGLPVGTTIDDFVSRHTGCSMRDRPVESYDLDNLIPLVLRRKKP